MLAVDGEHQAVEEAPPLGGRAHEQPVHRRRQPHHAQMIAEGGGGGDRLAVDAAAAARRSVAERRLDAGPERGQAQRALDLSGYRPGTVALIVGDVFQRGAAKPAARRQE